MAIADLDTLPWPQKSSQLDINHEDEVRLWAQQFRVSTGMLKQVVRAIGPKFEDIERFLTTKR